MQEKLLYAALFIIIALMLAIPALAGLSIAPPVSLPDPQPTPPESGGTENPLPGRETRAGSESEPQKNPETGAAPSPDSEGPAEERQTEVSVYFPKEDMARTMPLEEYVRGVVMAEMPATFAPDALMAQAVAARTYCLYHLAHGERHAGTEAHICTDYTHCMAYLSDSEAEERWGADAASDIIAAVQTAVSATEGEYLTYDGAVICALFHSGSYQMTESAENVWGNPIPYLVSVPTPEEAAEEEVSFTAEEWRTLFTDYGTVNYTALLFQSGDKISMVLEATVKFYVQHEDIQVMYVYRDSAGNPIPALVSQSTIDWYDLFFDGNYQLGELDLPKAPTDSGSYSVTVYFNGAPVASNEFVIS